MGVVYRAEDTVLGRIVALKFLPPSLVPNPRARARFQDEARVAATLDHPNICTIYEVGETAEGQLYIAMAYYEGETLKQRLERGPLPAAEALHLTLQVARGLAKAHCHGIVHRDIKPANLMITADGLVKILDFGIAWLPAQGKSGPSLGTPGYMAPEQERGGEVNARSDIWALGAVLHEMLTGRLPYRGGHSGSSGKEEPPASRLPPEPPGLDILVSHLLADDPADRYPDVGALLGDLAELERTAAGPEKPPSRQLPVRAAVLAAAAALALFVGLWLQPGEVRNGGASPAPDQAPLTRLTDLPGKEWFSRLTPDGKFLVYPGEVWNGGAPPHPGKATLTRLTDLPGKEWFPSLTPDGKFLVYARKIGDRSRLFLRRVGGDADHELLPDSQEGDFQPAVSPDGQQIAFRSEREGGGIFIMGLMGESVRRVTDFGFNPAWSPDSTELAFATEGIATPQIRRHPSQLYRVHLATGELRLVHTGDAVQPSWSPHGHRIAYWSGLSPSGERALWTVPADGGKVVRVTDGRSIDWNPVWAPDGRALYFASDRSGVTNLWRLPIDERSGRVLGQATPVATSGQASMHFSLSRDGRHIAYASDETRTVLEKVSFDPTSGSTAGPAVEITQTSDIIATIDASPDNRWLVFQTSVPQEDLFVIQADGTGLRRLTDDKFKDRQPRWSPDGTRIAFYSNRGGSYEIWTIRADGSGLERAIALPGKRIYHPIWSPDGRQIACDLAEHEALLDLTLPLTERRPQFLAPAGPGLGFSASSWSADGRWLAGALHAEERQLPGVVLYSLADKRYVRITDRGQSATWLSDSRHLLYWDDGRIFLLDTASRTSRQVLATPPGSDYNDFSRSPDDRFLYLARDTEQGDIWMLTLE